MGEVWKGSENLAKIEVESNIVAKLAEDGPLFKSSWPAIIFNLEELKMLHRLEK